MTTRMRLRRSDGQVYMDRWGFERRPWLGVYLHKFTAPDPGIDLHDHPWTFWSLILKGGYTEERSDARVASQVTRNGPEFGHRGRVLHWRRWSIHRLRMDECHRIVALDGDVCWTLVVHGPWRRRWGFYMPGGFIDSSAYSHNRRDLWNEKAR